MTVLLGANVKVSAECNVCGQPLHLVRDTRVNSAACLPINSTLARSRDERFDASAPIIIVPAGMRGSPWVGSSPPQGDGVSPTTYPPTPGGQGWGSAPGGGGRKVKNLPDE